MENIISSTFTECWEQSAWFAMIRCLTGPQIVQVSSFVLVQNRLHPSILYRTDDYTSPAERTSVFVRQTVTWTSFSFSWKTRFGSFDQWTLFFFPPISFAHHADKSECLRLQFFLFWVSHVQHVHTDERSNLRSIFLLAASNSLNWVWPARKSFANTSF